MILPYVYKLVHKQTGQFYFGLRYKNVKLNLKSEEDLGIRYKSSSEEVKKLGFENFYYFVIAEFFDWQDGYDFEQLIISENIKDDLCLNKSFIHCGKIKFQNIEHSDETKKKIGKGNKGKNKENCPNKARRAKEMTGQTKETSEHVAKISKTVTGRTKETHEYVAIRTKNMITTLTGRTKETHDGPRKTGEKQKGVPKPKVSEALTGRTKETHEYIEEANNKKRGRNKNNYSNFAKMARSFCILSEAEELKLYELRNEGFSRKEVANYFNNKIAVQTVSTIYYRIKNQLETITYE